MHITHVERHGGLMERLLPVRSHRQLVSYVLSTLLGVLLIMLCLALGGVPATVGAMPVVLVGALVISSVALALALPARFVVEVADDAERAHAIDALKARASALGYAPLPHARADVLEYETRRPRWLRWEENRISLETLPGRIVVTGPIVVVRLLHSGLAGAGTAGA